MSFLSRMGEVLHKVEGVLTTINPLAALATGTIAAFLPSGSKEQQVVQAIPSELSQGVALIQTIEAAGQAAQLPGAQKLAMAAGPMAQIILQSEAFAGKKIANPDLFKQGAQKIADGLADCLNSIDESEVKAQSLPH